jgi:hypothetical protein
MPKLTTKYSILALNSVSRRKLVVYRSKNWLSAVFGFMNFFNFLNLERIFEKKPVVH